MNIINKKIDNTSTIPITDPILTDYYRNEKICRDIIKKNSDVDISRNAKVNKNRICIEIDPEKFEEICKFMRLKTQYPDNKIKFIVEPKNFVLDDDTVSKFIMDVVVIVTDQEEIKNVYIRSESFYQFFVIWFKHKFSSLQVPESNDFHSHMLIKGFKPINNLYYGLKINNIK